MSIKTSMSFELNLIPRSKLNARKPKNIYSDNSEKAFFVFCNNLLTHDFVSFDLLLPKIVIYFHTVLIKKCFRWGKPPKVN